MPPIEDLKEEVTRCWAGRPEAELCLKIIDCMALLPAQQREMFTFGNFCRMVGKVKPDLELLTAVTILVGSKIQALDARALFVDEQQKEHEIDLDELSEAKRSGALVHPVTGTLVTEYEAAVIPFFVPSPKFRKLADVGSR
ncbi:MAG TPA: hypothetical protein VNZ61_20990 [Roseomonas sp.]|nr:hypothetical protein [Roseomonas sp.]